MHLIVVMMMLLCGASAAPVKAVGELTDGERLFQGVWQLKSDGSSWPPGTLRIAGRNFSADTIHGSYEGSVRIRSDMSPAQVDFTIKGGKFDGMTSAGIYYEDKGTIVIVAPAPGEPRPESFTGLDETKVLIERATRQDPQQGP